ncbi:MAG: energy-coupling factor transporter transmembrane protein EcfT [Candidatus Odinarchaeota archaeon]|nr:energy-coupling factor transporter transmembrane protein EcfT [Candidatus Odinarchaeota archaeon]
MSSRSFLFYLPKKSPFHKLNPLSKLAIVFSISFIALIIRDFELNFWVMIVTLLLLLSTRVPLKHLKTPLISVTFMMITLTFMYSLLSRVPGERVYIVFPWGTYFTENTLVYGLTIVFRVMSMVFATLLLLATTKDSDIIRGLSAVKIPYVVCFTLSLAIRSISMFADDWHTILEAYRSKGMDLSKGSIIERLRNYVGALIPLVVLTLNKVKDIDFAAESRGFRISGKGRTQFEKIKWAISDVFVFVISILAFLYFYLRYGLRYSSLNLYFITIELPEIPRVFPIILNYISQMLSFLCIII